MKPEKDKTEIQLRPDAPVYVPIKKNNTIQDMLQHFASKEPQCSRYSRKSVRRISDPNGPRPILGTKTPFPRPILGRKESNAKNENDAIENYIGMEFRSISRKLQRMKIEEEENGKTTRKKNKIFTIEQSKSLQLTVSQRMSATKWLRNTENCVQCKKMFGPYFKARACADACVQSDGLINLDCNIPETIVTFLKRLY
ncbi:hypothetical protein RN001_006820 [Aquatica leii]|uniref:Uncharacterized protein n=1 Tax=Aquatica leii TaxID=1421715 RepID=A0AAN7SBN9_9COLE|nr:hypothetical protein RN001_006820 [Aquatica leii]